MIELLAKNIREKMDSLRIPGCAIALVEEGCLRELLTFGWSDVEAKKPVTSTTMFSLQSVSKPIAAWAVLLLVERKLVDLDAPIGTYLKSFRLPEHSLFRWDEVTIRRLLSHHGGVTPWGIRGVPSGTIHGGLRDALRQRLPPLTDEQKFYFEHWKLQADGPLELVQRPGGGWLYSNVGFGLLECMLEDVTGEDYADFAVREVLRPLGLRRANFAIMDDLPYARPYTFEGAPAQNYVYPSKAAAGCYSSIVDLAKFASAEISAFMSDTAAPTVLTQRSVQQLFDPVGLADETPEIQFKAGLGHLIFEAKGLRFVTHTGGSLGWRSIYCIQPESGKGFCALMNSDQANDFWIPMNREWIERAFSSGSPG